MGLQLCSSQRAQAKMNNFSVIIAALVLVAVANAQPWGGQWQWPGSYGYGHSSTCFGCRGKRSAEPAYVGHPYGYGKRSAEPEPYYGTGVAYHPYGGSSYVGRTIWGFPGGYGYHG